MFYSNLTQQLIMAAYQYYYSTQSLCRNPGILTQQKIFNYNTVFMWKRGSIDQQKSPFKYERETWRKSENKKLNKMANEICFDAPEINMASE